MRVLFIFIGVLFVQGLFAQTVPQRECATMQQDSINRARFPQRGTLDEFENALQLKIRDLNRRKAAGERVEAIILSIPIVVHIVHNGEAVGSGFNISQAQVQSQLTVLNEDFRKKFGTPGFNNNSIGADVEVEFCLSPVDQNGTLLTEPGIHRYNGNKASWTRNEIENQLKPATIWNPNFFYNVWTVKFGGIDNNLLGYAQFPDQSGLSGLNDVGGPGSTDGVVVQYTSFGYLFPNQQAPYNRGRTLAHETGHWLGLRHIWGDGGCAADDFVADTPLQGSESRGCSTNKLSCDGVSLAMVQNYMDYSDDACMNIFTEGQKTRMRAVMSMSPRRKSLLDGNLCNPIVADVPVANFTSDRQEVLKGGEVSFTDLSTNFPTSWQWVFEGGDPSTSTNRNPKPKYNLPGTYKVSLIATNSLGQSPIKEIESYIVVSEEGLCSSATNFKTGNTSVTLPLSDFGNYTGYLTGHNSLKSKAVSEFFKNTPGYLFVSGVEIDFGKIYSSSEDATVTVTLWNARGPQNAPGSVVEQKVILLKQIQDDIAAARPTTFVFDRETPVFGRPFQIGVELNYDQGDSVAVKSSANGESNNATSWIQDKDGFWTPYSIALGANIAMKIKAIVGVNPSVQVSASKLLVAPGEEVILNGKGASVFVWNSNDGVINNFAGPQLTVRPTTTTTYTSTGSGLTLCNAAGAATIYVNNTIVGVEKEHASNSVSIFPNPGSESINMNIENDFYGEVQVRVYSALGSLVSGVQFQKYEQRATYKIEVNDLQQGLFLVQISMGENRVTKKWFKK